MIKLKGKKKLKFKNKNMYIKNKKKKKKKKENYILSNDELTSQHILHECIKERKIDIKKYL